MAAITPGTGGTLKSNSFEGALIEALRLLRTYELDTAKNLSNVNYVLSLQPDWILNKLTANWSIPVQRTINATTGATSYQAAEYLTNVGYLPGTGGTLKSATLANIVIEVSERIQELEAQPTKNPQGRNALSASINTDSLVHSGSFELAITLSADATGNTVTTVTQYLTA